MDSEVVLVGRERKLCDGVVDDEDDVVLCESLEDGGRLRLPLWHGQDWQSWRRAVCAEEGADGIDMLVARDDDARMAPGEADEGLVGKVAPNLGRAARARVAEGAIKVERDPGRAHRVGERLDRIGSPSLQPARVARVRVTHEAPTRVCTPRAPATAT